MKRFRGGLVVKAHRLVYHSTLGWRVIKKRKLRINSAAAELMIYRREDDIEPEVELMAVQEIRLEILLCTHLQGRDNVSRPFMRGRGAVCTPTTT